MTVPGGAHGATDAQVVPAGVPGRKALQMPRLLAAAQTNDEIARPMFASASTVRTHVRCVYTRLRVNGHADAIVRATAMRLLRP